MIRFNALLRDEGIAPADVKLVRHRDTRHPERLTPYQLWQAADGRFDLYQQIQQRPVFKGARFVASFVATPLNETLFVGLYENRGVAPAKPGLLDPISGKDAGGLNRYDLVLSPKVADYRGRLIVEWGPGYRSWVQLARKKEKAVVEIHRSASEPPFPGFLDFRERLNRLAAVPVSWRAALSAISGIYLFTHPDTGKHYVGSAQGAGGFWGRWEQYAASGHGGANECKIFPLPIIKSPCWKWLHCPPAPTFSRKWRGAGKQKLLTRKFGLNAN